MRALGVDWMQWLSARPFGLRQRLQLEDADGDDELDSRVQPKQSAEDRFTTLAERRDFLRSDPEARQRLADTLREFLDQDQTRDAARRMLQWLHEGDVLSDVRIDPPSSAAGRSSSQLDAETSTSPAPRASSHSTSADDIQLDRQQPIAASWQLEALLEVDLPSAYESPLILSREQHRPPLHTDEACRIIRCTDYFGVLLVGLCNELLPATQ
jgi:hypothetical protein